jgi:hypothetical protein
VLEVEILWGWLVIIAAVAFVSPLMWWGLKEEEYEFAEMDTQVITLPAPIEGVIVDLRPLVVDELGEWDPSEHELEQPLLLSHVLTTKAWDTVTPSMMGLVAA